MSHLRNTAWTVAIACVVGAFATAGVAQQRAAADRSDAMSKIAHDYVRLVLALGQHDKDYVDAYYGPADIKKASGRREAHARRDRHVGRRARRQP